MTGRAVIRIAALALLAATGCATSNDALLIRVSGMQRGAGGKSWMAWPESVKKTLEGLEGVTKVEMDLEHNLFRVTGPDSADRVLAAVRVLGYAPEIARPTDFTPTAEPLHPVGEAPDLVRRAIDRARSEGKKFVLVDCGGDDWVACHRMSVKTFGDPAVKAILEKHFVFVAVNVDRELEAAGWFAGQGVPDTWILGLDGRMLDRVVGFMEPQAFAARLRRLVER